MTDRPTLIETNAAVAGKRKRRPTTTKKRIEEFLNVAAEIAQKTGQQVAFETPNGFVFRIAPDHATVAPASPLDAWKAKRAGHNEGHS